MLISCQRTEHLIAERFGSPALFSHALAFPLFEACSPSFALPLLIISRQPFSTLFCSFLSPFTSFRIAFSASLHFCLQPLLRTKFTIAAANHNSSSSITTRFSTVHHPPPLHVATPPHPRQGGHQAAWRVPAKRSTEIGQPCPHKLGRQYRCLVYLPRFPSSNLGSAYKKNIASRGQCCLPVCRCQVPTYPPKYLFWCQSTNYLPTYGTN
ncbi:hypothetical protein IF2G_04482 [Cordyceps javanica]|nr:hypothetical protein IF2G_04482 [Cordyceps javanica]